MVSYTKGMNRNDKKVISLSINFIFVFSSLSVWRLSHAFLPMLVGKGESWFDVVIVVTIEPDVLIISFSLSSSKNSCRFNSCSRSYITEDDFLSNPKLIVATIIVGGGSDNDLSYYITLLHLAVVTIEPDVLIASSSSKNSCRSNSYSRSCITEDDMLSDPKPIAATAVADRGNGIKLEVC